MTNEYILCTVISLLSRISLCTINSPRDARNGNTMNIEANSNKNKLSLVWDQSFSVGAPILDSQHKSLFEIMNRLQGASESDAEKDLLLNIINDLYDYSTTHFRDEEALLKKKQSPLLVEQQTQHAIFLDYVIELEAKVRAGSTTVNEAILTFLRVWWEEHILKIDMQYQKLFINN